MKITWKSIVSTALLVVYIPSGIVAGGVIGYKVWRTLRQEKCKKLKLKKED